MVRYTMEVINNVEIILIQVWILNEYVCDKPNLDYRYRKVEHKYFYNDDIKIKYEFINRFINFKQLGFDYKV